MSVPILTQIQKSLDKLESCFCRQTSVIGTTLILLLSISLGIEAFSRPLWFDEVLTAFLSTLKNRTSLWEALLAVCDTNPPLFYYITRLSSRVFSSVELAVRVPAIMGGVMTCVALFRFVKRRASVSTAFVAALLPFITIAPKYFIEGRPYGLVLGLTAVSLVFWQQTTTSSKRIGALTGLSLSLMLSVSLQYYACLIFIPIFIGEAFRQWGNRKIDFPPLVCFFIGACPLLLYLPLIENLGSLLPGYWSKVSILSSIRSGYAYVYARALWPLLVTTLLCLFCFPLAKSNDFRREADPWPFYEIIAAIAFLLLPVIGVLLSSFGTGIFTARYALPGILGFSILAAYALVLCKSAQGRLGVLSSCVLLLFIIFNSGKALLHLPKTPMDAFDAAWFQSQPAVPVVFADGLQFLPIAFYAQRGLPVQPVYLFDAMASLRATGADTNDRILLANSKRFPLTVPAAEEFLNSTDSFLVIGSGGWVLPSLQEQGRSIHPLPDFQGTPAYLITVK